MATATFDVILTSAGEDYVIAPGLGRGDALEFVEQQFENGGMTGETYQKKALHKWQSRTSNRQISIKPVHKGTPA